jgi:hypothetical protein
MYYEIYEELKSYSDQNQAPHLGKIVNKALIDSFFDLRSQIHPIYKEEDDSRRLVGNNYPYLFYQKIIHGIARSIFVGLDPWGLGDNIFLASGRIKIQETPLRFNSTYPLLFFKSDGGLNFSNSSIKKWEDELMYRSESINSKLNLTITREGFRAHLYRILEILYSMRSSSKKRRTNWTVFLHEFIILQKEFGKEELKNLGFEIQEFNGFKILFDENFPTVDYLEFNFLKNLGLFDSSEIKLPTLTGTALEQYSTVNKHLMGKIPLCHFFINEHMFIGKEEYSLQQYTEYFVHPWTKAQDLQIHYVENGTGIKKEAGFDQFTRELSQMKYSIVLGFHENRDKSEMYFSAEPKMVKG